MKASQLKKKADHRVEAGKWAAVLAGVFVVAVLGALFFLVYSKRTAPTDYEGTIVDRWADYAESEQGSHPRLRLVVESQDGKRFRSRSIQTSTSPRELECASRADPDKSCLSILRKERP